MIGKLRNLLFIGFVIHLLVAAWFIVLPTFLPENRISRIYKTYLLPGPFFRDDRVTTTYNFTLSWMKDGQWSKPFNHSKKYFDEYYKSFDPTDLYMSRYIRSFDQIFWFDGLSKTSAKDFQKQYAVMGPFLLRQYVPPGVDSIHVIFTRKYVEKFSVKVDTVFNAR